MAINSTESRFSSFGKSPQDHIVSEKTARLEGVIKAPPSKSYTHRAVLIASMNGQSRILNPLDCDDIDETIDACKNLGAKIDKYKDKSGNFLLDVKGFKGRPSKPLNAIRFRGSGTSLRFILPIICLAGEATIWARNGSVQARPHKPLVEAIKALGADVSFTRDNGNMAITVRSKLKGGQTDVDASISSQFISSLLIACPKAEKDTKIKVEGGLVSKPYVEITLDVLKDAGIKIEHTENFDQFFIPAGQEFKDLGDYPIHGDYSSAAFLMAAACLVESDVTITDLVDDKQGDRKIIDILRSMGADIERTGDAVRINGPFELEGIDINCRETPDLVPVLAVLGAFAKGTTSIDDIPHLKHKESDRIESLTTELRKLGVNVEPEDDKITVRNSEPKTGGVVHSHEDHRIAMALSLIGLKVGKLTVENGRCISKSYPNFVKDMQQIGANIERRP